MTSRAPDHVFDQRRFLFTEATPVDNRHSYLQTDATVFLHPLFLLLPEVDKTLQTFFCGGKRSVCCATRRKDARQSSKVVVSPRRFALKAKRGWVYSSSCRHAVQSRPAYRFCSSPYSGMSANLFWHVFTASMFSLLHTNIRRRPHAAAARRLTRSCRVA